MAYDDVEDELLKHPAVRECVVTRIETRSGKTTLVAYVVATGRIGRTRVQAFLSTSRLRRNRIPSEVIQLDSLPRDSSGNVDRDGVPLPVLPGPAVGGKGPSSDAGMSWAGMLFVTVIVAPMAFNLTDVFWPGSTDLSAVPERWTSWFTGLYVVECLSFGLGVGFLLLGRRWLRRLGRPAWLTTLAHLSVVWLLVAWLPQDNLYRLAAKTDWGRQAALVYGFNITMMVAAAILVVFAVRER